MLSILALAAAQAAAPQGSCLSAAPPVGTDPVAAFPSAVDGSKLKSLRAVARLSSRAKGKLVIVRGGDFSGSRAAGLKLANLCFVDSKLQRSDWRGASASGLGFLRSDLSGSNWTGAQLPGVLLRESNLSDVNASQSVLDGGRLDGGWAGSLARLRLDGARLRRFQVVCGTREEDGCPFDRAGMSIRGTDFTGANLATFSFWDTALDGAILDNTHVGMGQIGQLDRLVVRGPIIIHSPRRHATLMPNEYLTVRQGVRPVIRAATTPSTPRAAPDPASCAGLPDRRERALCLGGSELQTLAAAAERLPRDGPDATRLEVRQTFCVNLSDDLIARCLLRAYKAVLAGAEAQPAVSIKPERLREVSLFASLPVRFTDDFRRSPLYTRVLPLFVDASPTQLVATPAASGLVSLTGGSRSGCRISADGLRFSPATGWYVLPTPATRGRARQAARAQPVARFTAAAAQLDAAATTCPEGATLDPMVRVDAAAELIELLTDSGEG